MLECSVGKSCIFKKCGCFRCPAWRANSLDLHRTCIGSWALRRIIIGLRGADPSLSWNWPPISGFSQGRSRRSGRENMSPTTRAGRSCARAMTLSTETLASCDFKEISNLLLSWLGPRTSPRRPSSAYEGCRGPQRTLGPSRRLARWRRSPRTKEWLRAPGPLRIL